MAKRAASNTQHVKIEKICAVCHSRSFANKTSCRSCGSSLDGAYTLLPGQWPFLGVPLQVLPLYDQATTTPPPKDSVPEGSASKGDLDVPMDGSPGATSSSNGQLSALCNAQLKAEITKLERSLSDSLLSVHAPQAISQSIANLKAELASRKSSGQQLDQALAKENAARMTREAAATRILGLEKSLETARCPFQQAQEAEKIAVGEIARIRSQLAETEVSVSTMDPAGLPVEVASAILGILRQADISRAKVAGLLPCLGVTEIPPTPSLPAPLNSPPASIPARASWKPCARHSAWFLWRWGQRELQVSHSPWICIQEVTCTLGLFQSYQSHSENCGRHSCRLSFPCLGFVSCTAAVVMVLLLASGAVGGFARPDLVRTVKKVLCFCVCVFRAFGV